MPIPINDSSSPLNKYLFQQSVYKKQAKNILITKTELKQYAKIESTPPRYKEIYEKKFFMLLKMKREAVVNLSKGNGFEAKLIHRYLTILANKHKETRFYHIDTEKNGELINTLNITVNPTIIVIIEGELIDIISSLKDFKAKSLSVLGALETRLAEYGVIEQGGTLQNNPQQIDIKPKLTEVQAELKRILNTYQ